MTSLSELLQGLVEAIKRVNSVADAGVPPYENTKYQEFEVFVRNVNGTLQHKILALGNLNPIIGGNPSVHADLVAGASHEYSNTPSGADATTGFNAGVKISSAFPHMIFLDTPEQVEAGSVALVDVISNAGPVQVLVNGDYVTADINGETKSRLALVLTNVTTAAGINWATHLGSPGRFVRVRVVGFMNKA